MTLRCIPKKQSIGFVSKIQSLRRLVVILGGRTNISEIQHPKLEELEILRVMGFDNLDSIAAFPSLRSLAIEAQIRLSSVRFTASNKNIQSFRIFNCKTLRTLEGLENLTELKSIRIGTTALDVDSILEQRLPGSLKTFAFFTGKSKRERKNPKKFRRARLFGKRRRRAIFVATQAPRYFQAPSGATSSQSAAPVRGFFVFRVCCPTNIPRLRRFPSVFHLCSICG